MYEIFSISIALKITFVKEVKGKNSLKTVFKKILTDDLANTYNWGGYKNKNNIQLKSSFIECLFGK